MGKISLDTKDKSKVIRKIDANFDKSLRYMRKVKKRTKGV